MCLRPGAVRGRRDGIGALANVAKMQSICVARNAGGPLPLPAGGCQLIEESSTMGGAYGAPCRRLLKPLYEEVVRCAMLTEGGFLYALVAELLVEVNGCFQV